MSANDTTLGQLPQPTAIRQHMGRLYRELALLRRLLRLSQAVRAECMQQTLFQTGSELKSEKKTS